MPRSDPARQVTLAVAGKFHAFSLASEFAERGRLADLYSITRLVSPPPRVKIAQYHNRLDLTAWQLLGSRFPFLGYSHTRKCLEFDRWVARQLLKSPPGILHGWNGCILETFRQLRGHDWLRCVERSCPHNQFQYDLMIEEGERLCIPYTTDQEALKRAIEDLHEADVIVCPSRYSAASYKESALIKKLRINPLGGNFRYRERRNRAGSLKVLMVGNAFLRKGCHYLIEAFKLIENPRAELWIRGTMPDQYRRRIDDPRVRVIGPVSRSELERLYREADLFVLPSIDEGFGMVVLEALSFGLPVVVTENVGAADILDEAVGFVVPIRDPKSLSRAILKAAMMQGPIFDRARRDLLEKWSWSTCADRMLNYVYH